MSSVFGLKASPRERDLLVDQAPEVLSSLGDHAALLAAR